MYPVMLLDGTQIIVSCFASRDALFCSHKAPCLCTLHWVCCFPLALNRVSQFTGQQNLRQVLSKPNIAHTSQAWSFSVDEWMLWFTEDLPNPAASGRSSVTVLWFWLKGQNNTRFTHEGITQLVIQDPLLRTCNLR